MEGAGFRVRRTFLELDPVPEQPVDERPARRGRSYSDPMIDVSTPLWHEAEEMKVERRCRAESCMDTILQMSEATQREASPDLVVIEESNAVEDVVTSKLRAPALKKLTQEEDDLAGASTTAESCKDSWRCSEQILSSGEDSSGSTSKAAPRKSVPFRLQAHLDPPSQATIRPRAMTEGTVPAMASMLSPAGIPGQVLYMLTMGPDGSQVLVPVTMPPGSLPGGSGFVPGAMPQPGFVPGAMTQPGFVLGSVTQPGIGTASLEARAAALQAYAKEVKEEARRAKAAAAAARRRGHDAVDPTGCAPSARGLARGRSLTDSQLDRPAPIQQRPSAPLPQTMACDVVAGVDKVRSQDDGMDLQDTKSVQEEIVRSVVAAGQGDDEDEIENDDRTTLMFRNLPNNYTRTQFLDMLDSEGFNGYYSFVYLPTDFKNFAGFGYSFVNFAKHEGAVKAKQYFQGFKQWRVPSRKVCDVVWSGPVQGLSSHTERYRNSPVMHDSVPDEYKPLVFLDGVRVPFPPPTKRIRPPRVRHGIASEATSAPSSDEPSGARNARKGGDVPGIPFSV